MTESLTLRAWECLTEAAYYYNGKLLDNSQALTHLKEKYAFNPKIIRKFLIGYAENPGLIEHLTQCGFTLREMTASGAFRPDDKNQQIIHPVFKDRLVFPYITKGQAVFMIALKPPWISDYNECPKYRKLPIYDPEGQPWVAEGIDGRLLYNQDILIKQPDFVIVTEGIPDCISLDYHGFPAISPAAGDIREDDWDWILSKLEGVGKVIFCPDNRIQEAGWKVILRSARRLSKAKISCQVAQPPLGEKQKAARDQLRKYNIHPGITSRELAKRMEETSLREYCEIQRLVDESNIDICSFFISTSADFQQVIDSALLPVEYAVQSISGDLIKAGQTEIVNDILLEIGRQTKLEQDRLIREFKKKTGEGLTSLRAQVKEAVQKDNARLREEIERRTERQLGPPIFQQGDNIFYLSDNTIKKQSFQITPSGPADNIQETANFHIRITEERIDDDGEVRENGSTIAQKTLLGEIAAGKWKRPFQIKAAEWGNNAKLARCIFNQAGHHARFSPADTDIIRLAASIPYDPPRQKTVYSFFGIHPSAGFVSPSLTIRKGKIIPTSKTGAKVEIGNEYAKARRLDLEPSPEKEAKKLIQHLLEDYLDFQPRNITLPVLAHAFLGPLLFGMNLERKFPPYILFLAGSSWRGMNELSGLAQSIWGDFQAEEQSASRSTPKVDRQEAAKCRGALWTINNFKSSSIRVLLDSSEHQSIGRTTSKAKIKCMFMITGKDIPKAESPFLARCLLLKFNPKKDAKRLQSCLSRRQDYRKIPAHYIAWLQKQKREVWINRIRSYLDSFADSIYLDGLNTDNSQRLVSNAALSGAGLRAFLEFAAEIEAINQAYADSLMSEHEKILKGILAKMLLGINEFRPLDIFISELKELLRAEQVKILDHYVESHIHQGIPVIGYYKENRKFICLLPKIVMEIVRKNSRLGDEKALSFSSASISRELIEKGYIKKPGKGRNLTGRERIPGGEGKSFLERVWKIKASILKIRK